MRRKILAVEELAILSATCLLVGLIQAQTTATPGTGRSSSIVGYQIGEQGADSRVWQKIVRTANAQGHTVLQTNQAYVELATGMNYMKNGRWVESTEEINILPNGTAAATAGRHQAYFPGDIYQGEIRLVTADGKALRSRPLGLSYFDGNNSVLIAELKDSTGWLVGSNQVVYPDAFTDFKADLRYTYTKAGFEQDIILREQPPDPASFGLNPETTRLQVLTEFFNPPRPKVLSRRVSGRAGNLEDHSLSFGAMQMGQGKAFLLGTNSVQAEVNKQWLQLEGRQFLVEEVPVASIADGLDTLPQPVTQTSSRATRQVVSKNLVLPPQRLAGSETKSLLVAQASLPSQGLVLDYQTINSSQTNYTFQGDTTYCISGTVNLFGTNTFEGGTVIKYNVGASLNLFGILNWQASAYRPVVFTAVDDNSVGESFGSGDPSGYYANPALRITTSPNIPTISNFRIAYAQQAVSLLASSGYFYNGQIVNCQNGFYVSGMGQIGSAYLRNVLFGNVQTDFNNLNACALDVQNSTFSGSSYLSKAGQSVSVILTNCLLVNVTNLQSASTNYQVNGSSNGFYNSPEFGTGTVTSAFYPFQTVGAGSYYLTNGCNFFNQGTTNIDSTLLADIRTKTTYPPIVYSNVTISTNLTLSPQVQRDTDTPDLGYHYDPLDYCFGGVLANSNITVTAGTAVGWFYNWSGESYGISLGDGVTTAFNGTATNPCVFARYYTVQEGGNGNWTPQSWLAGITGQYYANTAPVISASFTRFAMLNSEGNVFRDDWIFLYVNAVNCEFWSAAVDGYYASENFTNCLFFRSGAGLWWNYAPANLSVQNCTFIGGSLIADHISGDVWPVTVVDSAFDGTTIYMNAYDFGTQGAYCDYNAFLTNADLTAVMGGHELTNLISYNWQSGWLGHYYLPPNSPLIDKGSTNANLLGLYHFTTQTNQVKEANSIVDIGYHYVATDNNGNPLDSNSDGIPDYIEDANGNGLVDNGESPWMTQPPVITLQPTNQSVIQGSNATFSVTAAGTALSYQWYFNSAVLTNATNTTLTLNNVQPNNVGTYYVIVANATSSVTSSNAVLTVDMLPSAISGLKLWLEANAGITTNATAKISTWADQSGSTNNATQSNTNYQPLYVTNALNGLPVVRFNPTNNQYFNFSLPNFMGGTTGAEAFVVLKVAATVPGASRSLWGFGGYYNDYPFTDGQIWEDFGSTTYHQLGNPAQPLDQYHVYEVAGQTNYWAAWINGLMQGSTNVNSYFIKPAPTLGANVYGGQYYFAGDIAEVLIFNRTLTTDERTIVNGYLELKYGLVTNTPPAPTNLVANAISTSQISLTWNEALTNGGATQIGIERSTSSGGPFAVVATVANALSYMDTNLAAGTTYYYEVVARNAVGTSGYSNPAWATTLTNGVSLPSGNLALWLKADAGVTEIGTSTPVSFWADQSGNGNNATQPTGSQQPLWMAGVLNGLPVVRFNPTNSQYFNLPNVLNGTTGAEAFVVLKAAVAMPIVTRSLWGFGGYYNDYPSPIGQIWEDFGSTTFHLLGKPAQPLDQYNVYEVAGQTNYWAAWINGLMQGSTNVNSYFIRPAPTLGVNVCNGQYYYFAGDIAEVLIFNRMLTANERTTVNGYLDSRYRLYPGISIISPTNNAVVATGNISLTAAAWGNNGGNIRQVEFFQGSTSLGISPSTSSPYSITWSNMVPGNYSLTACATGSNGLMATSSVINITVDSPPTVSIFSPTDYAVLTTTNLTITNLVISATASASVGIYQVQFFTGTNSLGIAMTSPYSVTGNNLPDGTNLLTAVAVGNDGLIVTSSVVHVIVDIPPVVTLTTPTNNTLFAAPANIAINASASDSDGTVAQVQFYAGNLLLGTTNTSYNGLGLYSVTWNNALLGTNVLTAVATDNNGITTTSAPPVNVIVDAPPTITITNPAIGALIVAPTTNLVISATASASVGISRVQFFTGTNSLGVATTSPYSVTGNNLPTGTNLLKAVAVGNDGFTATSSVVHVIVDIPPVVTLTTPTNNTLFAAPANIAINASASNSDGTMPQVQFFQGATSLGVVTTRPYNMTWSNALLGTNTIKAVATDNYGLAATSGVVHVIVDSPPSISLQPANQTVTQGSNAVFTVAATGTAPLSYRWLFNGTNFAGATNAILTLTNVQLTNAGNYSVVVTNVVGSVTSSNAVLTVNVPPMITQQPQARTVNPQGTATFSVTVSTNSTLPLYYRWYFNSNVLPNATSATLTLTNVQLGQAGNYSVVVANLYGSATSSNALLTVRMPPVITTQPASQAVIQGSNVTFSATVSANSTLPLSCQWYFNGTNLLIGGTNTSLTLTNVQTMNVGNYSVVINNMVGGATSSNALLTLLMPPTISIISPADGQFFNADPTNLTLTATAGEVNGNIVSVAFYNGANLLGSATVSPYTVTWSNVTLGSYALTACATDDSGLVTTSSVVNVIVDAPPAVSVTSPANGAVIITPTNLTISAAASNGDGTVTQLQIFAGTNLLGTSPTSPFSLVWSNVPPGTWNLTAVATDNLGATGISSAVTLTANPITNLLAIADAYVRDGSSYSNVNYGTNFLMECLTTNGTGNNRDIYFKFDISAISSNVSSAKLNVFATVTNGAATNTVYAVTSTSWLENTITWSNKPARGTALSTNNVSGTNWYLYDITGYIRSQRTAGSNWVSLALHDPATNSRLITINSKENTNKPALIILTTNPPPTVNITSPTNNTVYVAPAGSITINATATDDGGVAQVQFFQGATSLGVVTTPSYNVYNVTWNNAPLGTNTITAVATDNYGLTATSVVHVIVDAPPMVTLTNPAANAFFIAGTNINLGATASDTNGTVTQVQFFAGTTSLGIDTSAPYSWTWTNATAGTNALTAVATDNNGVTTTSAPVNITVDALPMILITNPVSSAAFTTPTNITIAATASNSDGTMPQVQFFAGGIPLGTCTSPPYNATWTNPPVGAFALTAVATDDYGLVSISTVTNIIVNLSANADAYVRDGSYSNNNYGASNLMECLTTNGTGNNRDIYFKFDISAISSNVSSAQLKVFATVSTSGTVTNTAYAVADTNWGEYSITWSNKPARGTALSTNKVNGTSGNWYLYDVTGYIQSQVAAGSNWVSLALHDPANTTRLIKINSRENATNKPALVIVNTNPPPTVNITSPTDYAVSTTTNLAISASASDSAGISQVQFFTGTNSLGVATISPYSVTGNNLPVGTNLLTAVAVGNDGLIATSSVVHVIVDIPPMITLINPASNAVFAIGSTINLGATASDVDGTVTQVQFFAGTTSLGIDTSAPYGLTWSNAPLGTSVLTAVATDNNGITTISAPVNVLVETPPTIAITSPANKTSIAGPTNLVISASVSDSDGTVTQVQFYAGNLLLGTCSQFPYSVTWNNPLTGIYPLTAVATDNAGLSTTSPIVAIDVLIPGVDTDGDGLNDLQEYLYGSNPNVSDGFWLWVSSPENLTSIP